MGRKRRIIVPSNGENIYPDEIEELIMKNKGIAKAKVFEKDEKIHAAVYVKGDINVDKIMDNTNSMLSTYKQIKGYDVIKDTINTRLK